MKNNDEYLNVDKVSSNEIMSEFTNEEWTEECQSCKGTGRQPHTYRIITVPCRECEGEGYITYEKV